MKQSQAFCVFKDLVPDDAGAVVANGVGPATGGTKTAVCAAHLQQLRHCLRLKVHIGVRGQDVGVIVINLEVGIASAGEG